MCEFEEFLFNCGCSQTRLKSYCHFARNDPNHQCFGVKKLRNVWEQQTDCQTCRMKAAAAHGDPYASYHDQWQGQYHVPTQRM